MKTNLSARKSSLLLSTALIALAFSNVASFYIGNSNGFRQARKGWISVPAQSGTITIAYNDGSSTPTIEFVPRPNIPLFRADQPWNSDNNKDYLEYSIKHDMVQTLFNGTKKEMKVVSAGCIAQSTSNFWDCTYRLLGETSSTSMRVEVNPESGEWQSD